MPEVLLCGFRFAVKQEKLSSEALQFSRHPALLGTLGPRQRLVDRREALSSVSCGGVAFRQPAQKRRLELGPFAVATEIVDRGPEKLQSRVDISLLDAQHTLETPAVRVEDIERVPCRLVQQHVGEPVRRSEIAGVQ